MNPETKATSQQIKTICDRHGIAYKSDIRVTVGFNHEVHRINDDLILKIYNVYGEDDSKRFRLESALLSSKAPFLKPKLIVSDNTREIIDRDYIIMSYVPGLALGGVWHLANDDQREKLVNTICDSLKVINTIDIPGLDRNMVDGWEVAISHRLDNHIKSLLSKSVIDEDTAEKIRLFFDNNRALLSGNKTYPVFWDVHFDNFIVDDDFNLMAILDFETVMMATLDYPLFVIQKTVNQPKTYLSEQDEKFAERADYVNLRGWYKKYYPEMFAFDNLDERVKIYMLLDTLHMLEDWSHIKSIYDELGLIIS